MRAEFTDDLITGNELIDSQHEELIGRINKLLDSCEAGEGKISAIKMLDYLAKCTWQGSLTSLLHLFFLRLLHNCRGVC